MHKKNKHNKNITKKTLENITLISAFLGKFSKLSDEALEKKEPIFFQFQVQYELHMNYDIEQESKRNNSVKELKKDLEEFFYQRDEYRRNNGLKLPSKFIKENENINHYPFKITLSSLMNPFSEIYKNDFKVS